MFRTFQDSAFELQSSGLAGAFGLRQALRTERHADVESILGCCNFGHSFRYGSNMLKSRKEAGYLSTYNDDEEGFLPPR